MFSEKPFDIRQRCFLFSCRVIEFVKTRRQDRIFSSLLDQLIRSATSIGANVAESSSGSSKRDWINFRAIALKSANETVYWLNVLKETMSYDKEVIADLLQEAIEISKIIGRIIVNSKKRG